MPKKKEPMTIYLVRDGMKPLSKGQAVMVSEAGKDYPLAYIKKAKGASEAEYWRMLDFIFRPNV